MNKINRYIAMRIIAGLMAGAISSFAMAGQADSGKSGNRDVRGSNTDGEHVIQIERADKRVRKISIPFEPQQIKHIKGGVLISGEKDGVYHDMLPLKLEPGERLIGMEPTQDPVDASGSEPVPVTEPVDSDD